MPRLLLICLPAIACGVLLVLVMQGLAAVVGAVLIGLPCLVLAQAALLWVLGKTLKPLPADADDAGPKQDELTFDFGDFKLLLAQLTGHVAFLYGVAAGRVYFIVLGAAAVLLLHWLAARDRLVLQARANEAGDEELSPYDDPWAMTRREQFENRGGSGQ